LSFSIDEDYARRLKRRHLASRVFERACLVVTWSSVTILAVLLGLLLYQAWGWLDLAFLTRHNHYEADRAGVLSGVWGSCWLMLLTAFLCVPVGVGTAVYLEEYAKPNWLTRQIRLNIANLAGVPSVVYGILGFTVFVRFFGLFDRPQTYALNFGVTSIEFHLPLGAVILSGGMTLALLSLPVVVIASQEALRSVPASLRHASYALGATRWQTIWNQVLPAATPGIATGVILAVSRAVGETAPLVVLGAATQISFNPGRINSVVDIVRSPGKLADVPFDNFTALPLLIYGWVNEIDAERFAHVAAAGIIVLLGLLLLMNGAAIYIRQHFRRKIRW
jgi:phosphate transport system permease protein